MNNKFFAVVAIVLASMTAAGVGSYLALRERAPSSPAAGLEASGAEAAANGVVAPPAVSETEQALSMAPASGAATPEALGSRVASPTRESAVSAPAAVAPSPKVTPARSAPVRPAATAPRPAPGPAAERREAATSPRGAPARTADDSRERAAPTARAGVETPAESDDRGASPLPVSRPVVEPVIPAPPPAPVFEELFVPADAVVGLQIDSTISTERARVEDPVNARITRDVRVDGRVAIPAGSRVQGTVTLVERGGKIKDRARLGVRFHTLVLADGTRTALATETLYREGESVSGGSAAKIGGGAVGGAIIGAILGGGKGAAIGAATGAGGGTAAAMTGDRKPATLPAGSTVTVRLNSPVAVTVDKTPERDPRDR